VESALVEHPAVDEEPLGGPGRCPRLGGGRARDRAPGGGARAFGEVEIDDLTVRRLGVVERHDGELPG
jgi:hypothetical protein